VLTSGSGTPDPAALLGSGKLAALLAEATATYDVVLIDSTPILAVSDVIPVATTVDAVVVVARSDFTTRDAAQRCRHALERVKGVNIVGVVANGVRDAPESKRQYYVGAAT
jgi:Mrp family chromosome partitioning ATPase